MYALMLAIPMAGIIMSDFADRPVSVFGLFSVPEFLGANRDIALKVRDLHELLSISLVILVLVHIAGAAKHRYFDKADVDVLERII